MENNRVGGVLNETFVRLFQLRDLRQRLGAEYTQGCSSEGTANG